MTIEFYVYEGDYPYAVVFIEKFTYWFIEPYGGIYFCHEPDYVFLCMKDGSLKKVDEQYFRQWCKKYNISDEDVEKLVQGK